MTLAIVLLAAPPALWAVDRLLNRGELFMLIREELNLRPRAKAPRRPRITVAR